MDEPQDNDSGHQIRTFRIERDLYTQVEGLADADDRSANWMVNHLLRRALAQPTNAPTVEALREWADQRWTDTANGLQGGGKVFEMQVTFVLPNFSETDLRCYRLRDALVGFMYDAGAHDVVTRLVALGAMQIEPEAAG